MQKDIWEREYKNPKLVTGHDKPQSFFLKFLKRLRKGEFLEKGRSSRRSEATGEVRTWGENFSFKNLNILDLGSGTGRNANYLARKGSKVVGMEISKTAIGVAKKRAEKLRLDVRYLNLSIGEKYPFEDESFDLVIDITSSNSLNEKERNIYLSEVNRVLKKEGVFFVRTLCKDGDKNAKNLLKTNPGLEKDTYIMPETSLVERVFTENDLKELYSKYFKILKLEKTESYSTVGDRVFKRKFWLATMQK